jgi:conjugative transfer signal peptidase TraF
VSARRTGEVTAPLFAWGDDLRAAKAERKRLGKRIAAGAAGGVALLATALFPPPPRLVWNASASAPVGLYQVSPHTMPEAGDMVVARIPDAYRRLAATRRYLPANVPLVKRVVAVAGDDVCAIGDRIYVGDRFVARRHPVDGAGRHMPSWPGCIRLRGRQLFVLMDGPDSFDGRYFGVTEAAEIVGKADLIWAS